MEKSPPELVERFLRIPPPGPETDLRRMFGYPCAFVRGNLFMGLHERNMMLRLSPEHRAELIAAGGRPFEPMPGRPMKEYVTVPEDVLQDDGALNTWTARAYAFASALPPKAPGSKRRRRPPG